MKPVYFDNRNMGNKAMTSIKEDMEAMKELVDSFNPKYPHPERPLTNGKVKNTYTGAVYEPTTRKLDEFDRGVQDNRGF